MQHNPIPRTKLSERENAPAVWTDTNARFRIERNVIDGTSLWDEEAEKLWEMLGKHLGKPTMPTPPPPKAIYPIWGGID